MSDRPGGVLAPNAGALTGVAVSAPSGGLVTVNVNGVLRSVRAARDVTIAAGDVVLVHRFGSLWAASARLYTGAVSEMPPILADLDANPPTVTGATEVLPEYTGSYYSTGWAADTLVHQGVRGGMPNATGAIFYGSKPRTLAGATVTSARLEQIRRIGGPDASTASTLALLTEATLPSGAPTVAATAAGPTTDMVATISYTIPTAWAQQIVDGTAGGLGLYDADGSPWLKFDGRGTRPPAFTLVIDWSRTT